MTLQAHESKQKRWTREEFYILAEEGQFHGRRVQLVDGEIIEMAPQGHPHARCITYLTRWAIQAFGDAYLVRVQMPLNASAWSDPEPDIAVIPGPLDAYSDHPERAALVIEVSESSILLDRRKARIYAEAGVEEYWIVNLPQSQVEVYLPQSGVEREYEDPVFFKSGQTLAPRTRPAANLLVSDLFLKS
jgi:Uma2 family endonuclease